MKVKSIQDEDFVNYYKPSMFIGTCYCDWKCCTENNLPVSTCQNHQILSQQNIDIADEDILARYVSNPITQAVVIGGLEPFKQFEDVLNLIETFRNNNQFDEFVIYTGYYPHEIEYAISLLKHYKNIIIKFGRYVPNLPQQYDCVLQKYLASNNQYAIKIS